MNTSCLNRLAVALLFSLCVFASAQAQAADDWAGTYEYSASLGRTAGGTGIVIDYVVTISASNAKLGAVIRATGYQTDDEIRCDTRTRGRRISLYFNSYPNGGTRNQFGVRLYKKGDFLLSLEPANGKRYRVRWGKYNTELTRSVLFKKTS